MLVASSAAVKSEPATPNDAEKPETAQSFTTQLLKKSATYWKTIVGELGKFSALDRSFIIPEVLAALKEAVEADVDGSQQSEVACTVKILVEWRTNQGEYQADYAGLYRQYAAVVKAYADRLPISAQQSGLMRLEESLSTMIKHLDEIVTSKSIVTARVDAIQHAKKRNALTKAIGQPDSVLGEKRIGRLLGLLVAFKKETTGDVNSSFEKRLIKVVRKASQWLTRDLNVPLHLVLYRMIVGAVREFSIRIPEGPTRSLFLGLLEDMSDAISSSPHCKDRLAKIRNRVTHVFEELKQYRGKSLPPKKANELIDTLRIFVKDVTIGWNPYRDSTMRDCANEFKSILQAQNTTGVKARKTFKARLYTLEKWKIGEQVE